MIKSLKFHKNNKSDTLDILLHGSSGGMNYSLMQKIFDECVKQYNLYCFYLKYLQCF